MTDNYALIEPSERLCKNCWWLYSEKDICCEPEISEISPLTGARITLARNLRSKIIKKYSNITMTHPGTYLCENGKYFRPKEYSPNVKYTIKLRCPHCNVPYDYGIFENSNGKEQCFGCQKEIYLW